LKTDEAVLEALIDFEKEVSVVAARGADGQFVHYGVVDNAHRNHILDITTAPGRIGESLRDEAIAITRAVLEQLDVVGVLCVEFFVTRDGKLLINELAPRPHNSGHFTVDACITSQFEQQLRATCGYSLGSTHQFTPAVMVNLMGELWMEAEPNWAAALAVPNLKLHLYGKMAARPGRKMGHLTALANTTDEAFEKAVTARKSLAQ
jgi:5-(carboxyamino)imidazole ribonucleotide synthase